MRSGRRGGEAAHGRRRARGREGVRGRRGYGGRSHLEGGEELDVVVGLDARLAHLLAEAVEGGEVGRLRQVEHAHHLADLLGLQLLLDAVEVGRLLLPELNLLERPGVRARLEDLLGVELQHVLDLPRPRHHRRLEHVHALLVLRRAVDGGELNGRQRQQRLPLDLADRDVDAGDELVERVDHLAHDHLGPPLLVVRVGEQRQEDLLARAVHVLERRAVPRARQQVAAHRLVADVLGGERDGPQLEEVHHLLLLLPGERGRALQLLRAVEHEDAPAVGVGEEVEQRPPALLRGEQLLELLRLALEAEAHRRLEPAGRGRGGSALCHRATPRRLLLARRKRFDLAVIATSSRAVVAANELTSSSPSSAAPP